MNNKRHSSQTGDWEVQGSSTCRSVSGDSLVGVETVVSSLCPRVVGGPEERSLSFFIREPMPFMRVLPS